ncbi:MAG: SIS domain-containing protein [Burkholderiales bacterium]|nr:SIS domain-containing protein [Burkholderiales bacterium]
MAFSDLSLSPEQLRGFRRILITACGTALHAGMVGKIFYERLLRRPVDIWFASEFRYGDPIVDEQTLAIIISQSGETADTLAALRACKEHGATTLGIVNVVGSSIAREAHHVLYTYAGTRNLRGVHQGIYHAARCAVPAGHLPCAVRGAHQRRRSAGDGAGGAVPL